MLPISSAPAQAVPLRVSETQGVRRFRIAGQLLSEDFTPEANRRLLASTGRCETAPSFTSDNGDCGPCAWVQAAHSKRFGSADGVPQLSRTDVRKGAAALRVEIAHAVRTDSFFFLSEASRAGIAKSEPRLAWPCGRPPFQSEVANKIRPMRREGE